jgi:hypothetical protein
MSITIGDIKVPADYCSPVIMRLAERFEMMRDQHDAMATKYGDISFDLQQVKQAEERLKKQVAELKKENMRLFMGGSKASEAEPSAEVKPIDPAVFRFDDFMGDRFVKEVGAEVTLRTVLIVYREWVMMNAVCSPMNRKKALAEYMTKTFGNPVGGVLPSGAITVSLTWAGLRPKEDEEA